jgi:hypothetical protein
MLICNILKTKHKFLQLPNVKLRPSSKIVLEKLTVPQLAKDLPASCPLSHSLQPTPHLGVCLEELRQIIEHLRQIGLGPGIVEG